MITDVSQFKLADILPHADPMILLTKLIEFSEDTVSCDVNINADSMFYDEGINGVPAWVGIEYMAQAIAAYAGIQAQLQNQPVKVGFLLGCRRFESESTQFVNGDILRIKVQRLYQEDNGLGSFDCQIYLQNVMICQAKLNVFSPESADAFFDQ